jgi:hypothetical protein
LSEKKSSVQEHRKKPDKSSEVEHKGVVGELINVELMGLEHKRAFEER